MPRHLGKVPLFLFWPGLVLALLLTTCQDFGFLSQASGSTLGLALASAKPLLDCVPLLTTIRLLTEKTNVLLNKYTFLIYFAHFFSASGIPLRGSSLDFAQCSRGSILRRFYGSST